MTRLALAVLGLLALAAAAPAQTPTPAAPAPPAVAPPADNLPSPPQDFTYSAAGRRDPFETLMRRSDVVMPQAGSHRPSGAAGLLVDEVTVRGIVKSTGAFVAMLEGAAARQTYTVKPGSRLFDGTVTAITATEVVFLQQVSDPLSLEKQREVRKPLRTQEEGK